MARLAAVLLWSLLLLTAGLPLAWLFINLLMHPASLAQVAPDDYRLLVFARTILLAGGSATLAILLAIPIAAALARGRWSGVLLWPVMAGLLVIPEPAWAYGWAELIQQTVGLVRPQSWGDYGRVILTNATAWWPIPAAAIALAWRRLPADVMDAATLDGARGRVTARLLIGPAAAGWAGAFLLSVHNLAAADQTGIVVASWVIRDTFQLGAGDQAMRIATATAAALPSILVTAGLAMAGWVVFRRAVAGVGEGERRTSNVERRTSKSWHGFSRSEAEVKPWSRVAPGPASPRRTFRPSVLEVGCSMFNVRLLLALVLLALILLPPILALIRTNNGLRLGAALEAHGESLAHGLLLAAGAAAVAGLAGLLGTLARPRLPLMMSILAFLLGGQFVALGMIRLYNPGPDAPQLLGDLAGVIYDTPAFHAAADVALFAWLPLAVAAATWTGRWVALRDMASVDGANALQAGAYVLWPLAWPGLLAGALAVLVLSLTEANAAALLVPGTPINFMLSNLHTLNFAAMAEAALLMVVVCAGATAIVVAAAMVWQRVRRAKDRRAVTASPRVPLGRFLVFSLVAAPFSLLPAGCDRPPAPEAIWTSSGTDDGQLAYPRAVAYSPADDTVWVIDKSARLQQFDSEGRFLQVLEMPESRYGKPVGLSVDSEGNVWVPDTHYYRVIVYRPDGTEWFRFGEQGEGPGQFIWPTDVLVLDDGRVLVSEYGSGGGAEPSNDRIQIFQRNADGTVTDAPRQVVGQIGSFGTAPGQFRRPQSMVVIGDVLWVADGTNHRLVAFDLEGNLLKMIGEQPGRETGQFRFPYGLDVDEQGHLLVSEFGNHRIQKIDPETGRVLATWGGSFGSRPGQAKYPWGISYDRQRGRVILIDSGNDRIQVVRM